MSAVKGTVSGSGKYLGAVLGVSGAVALLGFLAVNWPVATTAHSHNGPPASMASNTASSTPATMDIVPTPVTSLNSGHFAGTGDGSEGSWVRP